MKPLRAPLLLALVLAACSAAPPVPVTVPVVASASAPVLSPVVLNFPQGWPFPIDGAHVTGAHGMVSSDAGLATRAGVEVLAAGGNAVDAAVAVAFVLAVVHPAAGNIGGGGFLVARANGTAYALDFRETAPAGASRDMYLDPSGKPTKDSIDGPRAAGVPGSVAGLWEAHQKLGAKPWAELVAPAIKLAEDGFTVGEGFVKVIAQSAERLSRFPASAALFLPGGKPVVAGSTWKNPDLAAALRRIAQKGAAGFYKGPTADLVAEEMKRGNGLITTADLRSYQVKWRTPIAFSYRGRQVVSMPPPSSGGVTLAMMCHILQGYKLGEMGWHSPQEIHYLVEAMRRAYAARNTLGDPDFVKNPIERLLSEDWAALQRSTIKPDKATPSAEIVAEGPAGVEGPHTTHFSVVDAYGGAVGLTTTVNGWFGAAVTVTGAGFVLNNEMDDFAAKPGTPNQFALVQGEGNAIAPGKRMLSSMAPTIVSAADGSVDLVLGAAGGPTITTAVLQELSNAVDFGMDAAAAVNAPRVHQQHLPDVVLFEEKGLDEAQKSALGAMGYTLKGLERIADAPGIGRSGKVWIGAADPRRVGGAAAGW